MSAGLITMTLRLAVETGIGKQFGGLLEVENGEQSLPYLSSIRVPRPDDLFELGHGLDVWSSTTNLQVLASTPVVISSEVVAMTG